MKKITNRSMQRFAFTLVEVLIAVVLTLILLGVMIRAFTASSSEIAKGRAVMELAGQLRSTSETLRSDLEGATTTFLPRTQIGKAAGYFEYIEGPTHDGTIHTFSNGNDDPSGLYGDIDDVLMFTARSKGQPFRGRYAGQIIESEYAEIIWWTVFDDADNDFVFDAGEDLRLYRRVLLIRPDRAARFANIGESLQFDDLSVRLDVDGGVRANSLSDLTDRANRFARLQTGDGGLTWTRSLFPHEPNFTLLRPSSLFVLSNPTPEGAENLFRGEDIALTSLVAFDVKVFDPVVNIRETGAGNLSLTPSDFGYDGGNFDTTVPQGGFGGYVDLGIDRQLGSSSNGIFTQTPNPSISWTGFNYPFCTWSQSYESDGIDQDGDSLIDEGINGLDDNNQFGPDDVTEFETSPPYPFPLRGIQVTIRIIEPTNKIVRQTSVITNFVPE